MTRSGWARYPVAPVATNAVQMACHWCQSGRQMRCKSHKDGQLRMVCVEMPGAPRKRFPGPELASCNPSHAECDRRTCGRRVAYLPRIRPCPGILHDRSCDCPCDSGPSPLADPIACRCRAISCVTSTFRGTALAIFPQRSAVKNTCVLPPRTRRDSRQPEPTTACITKSF